LLALRAGSVGRGGVRSAADGVAVDDEFDAPIALAAVGGAIRSDRLGFAKAAGGNGGSGYAVLREEVADGIGAALRELLVEVVAADAVRMTFNLHGQAGVRKHNAGDFREFFAGAGLERVAAGVKKNVGHVHDEAAGRVAGLQNGIELREKLRAKLTFFCFGLRACSASRRRCDSATASARALASRSSAAFFSAAILA